MDSRKPIRISDQVSFPVDDFHKRLIDILPYLPAPCCSRAVNALRHLNKAWRLRTDDQDMAVFRSITAEEEAAVALFLSLKRHRYLRSAKLNHRNHIHKSAVIPFIDAVSRLFAKFKDILPTTEFLWDEKQSPARLILRFQVPNPQYGFLWALPQPPLNFISSEKKLNAGMVTTTFTNEIKQVANRANVRAIAEYLYERANFRNRILYATADGCPQVTGNIEIGLREYQRNVFTILKIYLMVDPYPRHQGFVQQCLDSFLNMLGVLPDGIKFE